MRWLRRPPVHFVALGLALFAVERYTAPRLPVGRPTVVITAARLAQLHTDFGRDTGAAPDERALVERAIDEAILYREALARGLDRDDQSIRWRLAEKMRFLVAGESEAAPGSDKDLCRKAVALELDRDDPFVRGVLLQKMRLLLKRSTGEQPPNDAELRAYLERHADRYVQPARASLWHVFLARERRAGALERDARQLLDRLRAQATAPTEAVRLGDPFPLGPHLRAQAAQDLTRIFGSEFAAAVLTLEPGSWAGPVCSPYGLHLVRVEETEPARTPPLEAVRSRVLAQFLEERGEARLAEAMRALRAKYAVRVEAAGEPG